MHRMAGELARATLQAKHVMATDAQIAANRRNALRSTGPRTPEGKARSSRNHLIHGLLAKGLIEGESKEEFLAIYEDFRDEYDPQTSTEDALVERIALACFRLGRFTHVEAQFLQREHAEKKVPTWSDHAQPFDRVANSYRQNMKSLHNLSLYENRLERSFERAVRELRRVQAQRASQPEPLAPEPAAPETVAPVLQPEACEIGFECSNHSSRPAGPEQPASQPAEMPEIRVESLASGRSDRVRPSDGVAPTRKIS
jgi:hypothetical protein